MTPQNEIEIAKKASISNASDEVQAVETGSLSLPAVPFQFKRDDDLEHSVDTTVPQDQHKSESLATLTESSANQYGSGPAPTSFLPLQTKSAVSQKSVPAVPIQSPVFSLSSLPAPPLQFKSTSIEDSTEQDQQATTKERAEAPIPPNPNPNGLPGALQAKMEGALGADFSSVQIHQNSSSATDVGALAYAQGNDLHFAPGQYQPESSTGQELIGHELAHVVQQREGRVQPTTQAKGLAVNDDKGLETEADNLGRQAAQFKVDKLQTASKLARQDEIIQRKSSSVIQMITDEDLAARADHDTARHTPFVFDPSTITSMERPAPNSEDADLARKLSIWPQLKVKRAEKVSLQTGEYEASTGFDLDSYSGDRGPGGTVRGPRRGPTRPEEVTRIRGRREELNREIQTLLESVDLHTEQEFDALVASLPARFEAKGKQVLLYTLNQNARIAHREQSRYQGDANQGQMDGLKTAAAELLRLKTGYERRQGEANDLQTAEYEASTGVDMSSYSGDRGPGGMVRAPSRTARRPEDATRMRARREELNREIQTLRQNYNSRRQELGLLYPILMSSAINYAELASGTASAIGTSIAGITNGVLENFVAARAAVLADEIKIWNMSLMIEPTKQAMGFAPESGANELMSRYITTRGFQDAVQQALMAAFQIGLALVATMGTGGIALAAGVAGAGLSVNQAMTDIQNYENQSAAAGSAVDPAQAISNEDPSLFWLGISIVGAAADIGGAAAAFRTIRAEIRAARSIAELEVVVRREAQALAASGQLADGMTQEVFIQRIMSSARQHMMSNMEAATHRAGVITRLMEPNNPLVARIIAHDQSAILQLLQEHGNWRQLMEQLGNATPELQNAARSISSYREQILVVLQERYGAQRVGTASTELISDVDLNVVGNAAGENLIRAERYMQDVCGENWSQMLRMNFYTEAGRLSQYERVMSQLSAAARSRLQIRMTELTEKYNFARMISSAGHDEAAMTRVMSRVGNRSDIGEIRRLAAMTPAENVARRNQLMTEVDRMMAELNSPNITPARVEELSEAISAKQIEANFHTPEAYIGPGAGRQVVSGVSVRGPEAYQSALSNVTEMEHIVHDAGDVATALRDYEFFKYVERYCQAARNAGVENPKIDMFEAIANHSYRTDRAANTTTSHLHSAPRDPARPYHPQSRTRITDPAQDSGNLRPVTDQYLRGLYDDIQNFINETLPTIREESMADPSVFAEGRR